MSAVTDQLCARGFETPAEDACENASTLAELPPGCRGKILGFSGDLDSHIARRLFDLGFVPGADAEFLRKAPMRDPLMFRIAGTEIVLRKREARRVLIAV